MSRQQNLGNGVVVLRHVPGSGLVVPSSPIEAFEQSESPRLRINVVFTDLTATTIALRRAVELATDLEAEIQIIVPHVVPYPLPLESPDVPLEFTRTKLRMWAASVGADPYVHVYLCRDGSDLLRKLLPVGSMVVLGETKPGLLPTKAGRIARMLQKNGCFVIVACNE